VLSEEDHAAEQAWETANQALALTERIYERMTTRPCDPNLDHLASRALRVGLALFDRAEHLQRAADTHPQERTR
jgi:hypothetical protein